MSRILGLVVLAMLAGKVCASEGVPVPPCTVEVVYPELRANADKALYFAKGEFFPTHHQMSWNKMARWIGALQPISAPDRRAGYVAVYSLPNKVMFVAIHHPDDDHSPLGGGMAVFRVEPRSTEFVQTWNRNGNLESTQIGSARWSVLFDDDGRVTEDTWYRWDHLGRWSVGGKEKFTYWPGTGDLRTVTRFGYPKAYDENQPWQVEEIPRKVDDPPTGSPASP